MSDAGAVASVSETTFQQVVPAPVNRRTLRRQALLSGSFLFWLYGIAFMFIIRFPKPVSDNPTVQAILDDLDAVEAHLRNVTRQLKLSKGVLWWASAAQRGKVRALQGRVEALQYRVDARRDVAREALVGEGHGVWSQSGVEDARRLFWDTFKAGRSAARDNSMLDSIYHVLNGIFQAWGEDMDARVLAAVLAARMLMVVLWNYTAGCLLAAIFFMARLPEMMRAYQPSFADATIFFLSSTVGAFSILTTFLALFVCAMLCCVVSTTATLNALAPPPSPQPLLTAPPVPTLPLPPRGPATAPVPAAPADPQSADPPVEPTLPFPSSLPTSQPHLQEPTSDSTPSPSPSPSLQPPAPPPPSPALPTPLPSGPELPPRPIPDLAPNLTPIPDPAPDLPSPMPPLLPPGSLSHFKSE